MEALNNMHRYKRRLAYKLEEQEAIKRLSDISKRSTKNIGYLRRRKENLEFRIATEAYTLEEERDLIRKKNEIEAELEEAIKSYRLRRKEEFIVNDITDLTKKIDESKDAVAQTNKVLDDLYANVRRIQGTQRRTSEFKERKHIENKQQEISLADIAVIKDKKEDKEKKDDGA
jgi:hypothetical protein